MLLELEGKKIEIRANGKFMKTYYEDFKSNMLADLVKASTTGDLLLTAQLVFSAIVDRDPELTFDAWLDGFETPRFIDESWLSIVEYFSRTTEPTVKPEKTSELKKTTN